MISDPGALPLLVLWYSLELFKWLVIIRAVMSWFVSPHSAHPVAELLRRVTDPILQPISAILPNFGGIDLSPIVAFVLIVLLQSLIMGAAL